MYLSIPLSGCILRLIGSLTRFDAIRHDRHKAFRWQLRAECA